MITIQQNLIKLSQFSTKREVNCKLTRQTPSRYEQSGFLKLSYATHRQNPLLLACLGDTTRRIYILMFTQCQIFLLEFNIIKLEFCQINHHFNVIWELTFNTKSNIHDIHVYGGL